MVARIIIISLMAVFFTLSSFVITGPQTTYAKSMLMRDTKNKVDPVSGAPIDRRKFRTAYAGKVYWFTSYSNVREFKKDPQKYVEQLQELEEQYESNPDLYMRRLSNSSPEEMSGTSRYSR